MRKGGLEPPWISPHAPQTCASANSATSARSRIARQMLAIVLPSVKRSGLCRAGVERGLRPGDELRFLPERGFRCSYRVGRVAGRPLIPYTNLYEESDSF